MVPMNALSLCESAAVMGTITPHSTDHIIAAPLASRLLGVWCKKIG
jgi:hypothetical protein